MSSDMESSNQEPVKQKDLKDSDEISENNNDPILNLSENLSETSSNQSLKKNDGQKEYKNEEEERESDGVDTEEILGEKTDIANTISYENEPPELAKSGLSVINTIDNTITSDVTQSSSTKILSSDVDKTPLTSASDPSTSETTNESQSKQNSVTEIATTKIETDDNSEKVRNEKNFNEDLNTPVGTIISSENGKKVEKSEKSNMKWIVLIFFIPIIISMAFLFFVKPEKPKCELLKSESLNLRNIFPNQDRIFFNNIISSYEHSILNNRDPSIILMVSDKDTKKSLKCVSRKLLKILNDAANHCNNNIVDYNSLIIDTNKFINEHHETAKVNLDRDLVKIIGKLNSRLVLVDDIFNIPAQSMMLFHGYGDDESNARYKGITILLTVDIDEFLYDDKINRKIFTSNIEKNLSQKWSKFIHYDQLRPLFARIMNNVVFVKNEEGCE